MLAPGPSGVEDELGNLPSLHPCPISAVGGALELKSHFATLHLRHPLLSEVAQLVSIQDHAGRVEGVGLDLDRILEPHGEGVAGAVGEVLAEVLSQQHPLTLQFDLGTVFCRATAWSVESEPGDKYSFVHRKLYTVTAAPVAPLIAPVGTGLESVAPLGVQAFPGLTHKLQLGLLGCRVPEKDVVGLRKRQHARLGSSIGKIIQSHCGDADQVHGLAQNLAFVVGGGGELLPLALSVSPAERRLEYDYLFCVECFPLQDALQGLGVNVAEALGA